MSVVNSETLLQTKLQEPHTFAALIERPRLLERLDGCLQTPLTLISAPAGFGKTTLVSQWLARLQTNRPDAPRIAWLSLDAQDVEPIRFLSYLIAAFRVSAPDAFPQTERLLTAQTIPSLEKLLTLFVNEIDALDGPAQAHPSAHWLLVLDDFDAVQNSAADQLLQLLVQFPSPRLRVILTCRRDPRLPLAQWNVQNKFITLRSRELRLTRSELQAFVRQNFPNGGAGLDLDLLEQRSEGWFAMLRLVALALRDNTDANAFEQISVGQQDIVQFFREQVLARQSSDMRRRLLQVSILESFTAELCEQVCDMPPGGGIAFLERLKAENLFLLSLDEQGVWFRFQHLFRQLLQRQLKFEFERAAQATLHRRASRWFRRNNFPDETIRHALAAGDMVDALAVVAEKRHEWMANEQWNQLANSLRQFSADAQAQAPDLLLMQAWLAHTRSHDFQTVERMTQAALTRLKTGNLPQARVRELRAECDVLTALRLLVRESDARQVIRLTQRALRVLAPRKYHVRSIAWLILSVAHQIVGELEHAHRVLRQAWDEDVAPNQPARVSLFGSACFIYWIEGDVRALEERARQLLILCNTAKLQETELWAHYFLACAQYEQDNLTQAEQSAGRVFYEHSPASLTPFTHAAFLLASCYQARNQPERARQALDDLERLLLARRSEIFLSVLDAFRANLAVRQGNLDAAVHWYEMHARRIPQTPAMHLFYAPQLTAPEILLALNTPTALAEAGTALERLVAFARQVHNTHFLIPALALQALWLDAQGKRSRALDVLAEAVVLGERRGARRSLVDPSPRLMSLLKQLKARGLAPGYLNMLVSMDPGASKKVLLTPDGVLTSLTTREYQVLALLAQRLSNKEIASKLFISPLTVKVHTDHIYQKFNVNSRQDAVRVALAAGILKSGATLYD